ncbi:MAG TPA: tetratricopeptide repeat protein [Candidatus Eisenbacteria bacterium]|nr:tetratricopeptide repeat protein [Candidatus Eisenbacteria bacterium]
MRAGIAGRFADGTTARKLQLATRLEPQNPEYWYRLGHYQQFNLEQSDPAASLQAYQTAVRLNPGFTEAWLDLGTTYELNGDLAAARDAFQRAKESYPASAEVAWRDGNFLLRQGDIPEALRELKFTLEADPRRAGAAFSRAYRADPDMDVILGELLPPIPEAYMDAIAEAVDSRQLAVAQTMWMRLMEMHPHLRLWDFTRLVSALMSAGDYQAARRVWDQGTSTMNLAPLIQPKGSVLWDPSFESGIEGEVFSWTFKPLVDGVHSELDTAEKLSGNQSLRLTFDGKHNPDAEIACSQGVVTPGAKYLFSGWIKTRELTGDQGIRFHLRSLGNPQIPVVSTKDTRGTSPWSFVEQQWTAAPGVHRVEVCISREPSTNADIHISGDAWVDDVTLVPEAAEHQRP